MPALLVLTGCTGEPARHTDSTAAAPAQAKRPNIVFVLTDDLSWNLVPYLPHVQAMQKEGTTFTNYDVVDSLCCPSRTSIFTGQYPHNTGVFTNGGKDGGYQTFTARGNETNTFAVALQGAGYVTGFMGKYLNGYQPSDPVPRGWNTWDVTGEGYAEFHYTLNENGAQHRYGTAAQDYLTDVLSGKAASFIDDAAGSGKPFLLEVATFAPHKPATPAPRDADSFPGILAPRTAAFDTVPADAPRWLAAIPPLGSKDVQQINEQFRLRVQSLQAVDALIGHLEDRLRATGLAKDTFVVFSSDNGYHMGEYRLRPGKQTAFDTDIKVPLVVTGPGVPAGRQEAAMTSSIDLAPTFETLAGAGVPASTDGASMVPLWQGRPPPGDWRQAVLIEHHGPDATVDDPDKPPPMSGNPPSYEAVRTATALYVECADGEREYYDTRTDPDQLANRASSTPASVLAPLQHALGALQACHGSADCQAAAQLR